MLNTQIKNLTEVNVVDQLGLIKAEIAQLQEQEKALKEQLIALGDGKHSGNLYDATVSPTSRDTLDMEAVRAKLSPQFIRAHTSTTHFSTIRVTARKGN
jgi:hypothetical protein